MQPVLHPIDWTHVCACILLCAAVMPPNLSTSTVKKSNVWTLYVDTQVAWGFWRMWLSCVIFQEKGVAFFYLFIWMPAAFIWMPYCSRNTKNVFLLQTVSFPVRSFILCPFSFSAYKTGWLGMTKEAHSSPFCLSR